MGKLYEKLNNRPAILLIVIVLLLPFAYFVNLGLMPLISDEPTRGIVTLEMLYSGNFITPTINGEFYYNKPPLFNWILAGFVQLSGLSNEFIFRLPTVISLLLTGIIIFLFARKELGKINAMLVAIMFITSARIVFWDSFQGLIDITYSLITFSSFTALYYFSHKRNYLALFIITYLLTAIGYLMKGLPSLAFQAISLVVWLTYDKSIRKLFSWQHLMGMAVFLLITGGYYFAYLQSNSLNDIFITLVGESNRLSDKQGTIFSWLSHLLVFPFEMSYEFAPWTVLLLLLLVKSVRQQVFAGKFIQFCLLIFISNIIIYWISADMRPRYLFMLFPLLFLILIKGYEVAKKQKTLLSKISDIIFQVLSFIGAFSLLVYLYWDETNKMEGVWQVVPLLFLIALIAALLTIKLPKQRIALLAIVILAVRIGFNSFNIPARYNSYPDAGYRQGEIEAGKLSAGFELYVLRDTPFNHDASFYITRERKQIVTRTHEIGNKEACYISDAENLANFAAGLKDYSVLHEFTIKLNESKLYLIKKNNE